MDRRDVNGYVRCDTDGCEYTADEYLWTAEELDDDETLVLCDRCIADELEW